MDTSNLYTSYIKYYMENTDEINDFEKEIISYINNNKTLSFNDILKISYVLGRIKDD